MKVLIAGGGTGGHFFSGVAVGEAFLARDPRNQVVYAGTRAGIEARVAEKEKLDVRFIRVSGLKGKGLLARLEGFLRLPLAFWDSLVLLFKERPSLVIGVGGYASGPLVMTARFLGKKTAIVEQNSIPGFTNKVLSRLVHRVYAGFPDHGRWFPAGKTLFTGNPIRRRLVETLALSAPRRDGSEGDFHLLVFGGSQGAHRLNVALVEAMDHLPQEFKAGLRLLHQTGEKDFPEVKEGYATRGMPGVDVRPFIHDMAEAYRDADLVICRAGASTLAELTVSQRPAILVPFPHAIYNHQEVNAQALVAEGAALLILDRELNGKSLAEALVSLAADPSRLRRMGQASASLGRPQAAFEVVDDCHRLVGWAKKP